MLIQRPALATDELNKHQVDVINSDHVATMHISPASAVSGNYIIIFTFTGEPKKAVWYFEDESSAEQCLQDILGMVNGYQD